jgi:RNA-directed DNA polymerase
VEVEDLHRVPADAAAHDAIAEIHRLGTLGYRWVLDADIEACFDSIDHAALMDRVRMRVKDTRVLALARRSSKPGSSPNSATSRTPTPAHRKAASSHRCWPTSR